MWKRELQFAVDQGALGGAWAKASALSTVRSTYATRARQEYDANLSVVKNFTGADNPNISLANYESGTNNSIVMTASVTKRLPFSSLLTNDATTISVRAQAIWNASADFHACMLALDPHATKAFTLGNSVNGSSTCGAGAISDDDDAMIETGDSSVKLGTVVSGGGIEDSYSNNVTGNDKIYQNQENLADPYADVEAPTPSGGDRSYPSTCPVAAPASTTYSAEGSTKTHYVYKYFTKSGNTYTEVQNYSGTGYIANNWSSPVAFSNKSVPASTTTGLQTETAAAEGSSTKIGNGSNAVYRFSYTSTQDDITSITTVDTPASDGKVHLLPGVYSSLDVGCPTIFSAGIYFVGGDLDFGQNQTVTGTGGVMFVLTGSSGGIHINSDSQVTLSGISGDTLINNYGYSSDDAAKLAGMLIYDPDSTDSMQWNGNANLHFSGIMYMPNRDAKFNGNASATSTDGSCIMIAAKTLWITGNFSLNNFCVSTGGAGMSVGGTAAQVKLVA
jgi:hypothetical protein